MRRGAPWSAREKTHEEHDRALYRIQDFGNTEHVPTVGAECALVVGLEKDKLRNRNDEVQIHPSVSRFDMT